MRKLERIDPAIQLWPQIAAVTMSDESGEIGRLRIFRVDAVQHLDGTLEHHCVAQFYYHRGDGEAQMVRKSFVFTDGNTVALIKAAFDLLDDEHLEM